MVESAKVLPLMIGGSATQRTEHRRTRPGSVHCLVSMVLMLSSVVSVASPSPTWAAVYQCRDAAGKSVLTNKPSQLRNCNVLSGEPALASTPPAPSTMPRVSPPSFSPDIPPTSSYAPPMPPNQPVDPQGASIGSLPAPNPGASSSIPPPQPCPRGLNPFNPLNAPPCARSDQSGAKPPEAARPSSQ